MASKQKTRDKITTDNINKKDNIDYGTKVRNADPSDNAEDFGVDATGRFVTTGSSQNTSAQINDEYKDTTDIRGAVEDNNPDTPITYKTTGEEINDREYEKQVRQGMSGVAVNRANDIGSEDEQQG